MIGKMQWASASPGGKRYVSTDADGRTHTLTRMNTAAGAKKWRGTVVVGGMTCCTAHSDYLADAKAKVAAWTIAQRKYA